MRWPWRRKGRAVHQDVPDDDPDPGAIFCSICHGPRSERRGYVLTCPTCDHRPTMHDPIEE